MLSLLGTETVVEDAEMIEDMNIPIDKISMKSVILTFFLMISGCGGSQEAGTSSRPAANANPGSAAEGEADSDREEAVAEDPKLVETLDQKFSEIIENSSAKYHPVVYRYDEDLLAKISAAHAFLSGANPGPRPARLIAEIEEKEEDGHIRETIKRWTAKTGRDFGKAIAELETALASVDRSKAFHPEFHRAFSKVFDDFVAIEVPEMRERRNREIHRLAREMLAPYADSKPKVARYFRQLIAVPPYLDPDSNSQAD